MRHSALLPPISAIIVLTRLLPKLDDLDAHQILPLLQPGLEQRSILRFHQLKTSVAVFFKPAIQIRQPFRQHPPLRMKSLIDLSLASGKEGFNEHVLLHVSPGSDAKRKEPRPRADCSRG